MLVKPTRHGLACGGMLALPLLIAFPTESVAGFIGAVAMTGTGSTSCSQSDPVQTSCSTTGAAEYHDGEVTPTGSASADLATGELAASAGYPGGSAGGSIGSGQAQLYDYISFVVPNGYMAGLVPGPAPRVMAGLVPATHDFTSNRRVSS